MKKRTKRSPTFALYEIRAALRKWKGIWMEDEDFKVSWYNFKMDLMDVKEKQRKRRTTTSRE